MTIYQNKKIPVFQNINSTPVAPSPQSGLNVGYLTAKFNDLVTQLDLDMEFLLYPPQTQGQGDPTLDDQVLGLSQALSNTIGSLNSLQTLVGQNTTAISNLDTGIVAPTETFLNNSSIYLDLSNGDDGNNGTTSNTPFATVDRLCSFLKTKLIPENLIIVIRGTVNQPIDLRGIYAQAWGISSYVEPKIEFRTDQVNKWGINHDGLIVLSDNSYPLNLVFRSCAITCQADSLKIVSLLGSVKFFDCVFDTAQAGVTSIIDFVYCDFEIADITGSNSFLNSANATLTAAIIADSSKGKVESCSTGGISPFCLAQNKSLIVNSQSDLIAPVGNIDFEARDNSLIRSNRFSRVFQNGIIIDSTSSINNSISINFALTNPPYDVDLLVYQNQHKSYHVYLKDSTFIGDDHETEITLENRIFNSNPDILAPNEKLQVRYSGLGTNSFITSNFELHEVI